METALIDFNEVLATYQEFGPRRGIPIEDRWREQFPNTPTAQINQWLSKCRAIEKYAYDLASTVASNQQTYAAARQSLLAKFPELNDDRLGATMNQAMYFIMK